MDFREQSWDDLKGIQFSSSSSNAGAKILMRGGMELGID